MSGWTLVLSGGGSKGAFEVGALGFLARDEDFLPDSLVGSSVGALTCMMLAQADSAPHFTQVLSRYQQGLLNVEEVHQVFARAPWLERYVGTGIGAMFDDFLESRGRPALPLDDDLEHDPLAHLAKGRARHAAWSEVGHILRHPAIAAEFGHDLKKVPSHLLTLEPMERMFTGVEDGPLPAVDETAIAASGRTLRMTVTTLGSGAALLVDEQGRFRRESDDSVEPDLPVIGPIQGALASASIPLVFPARRVGGEALVDGSVLRNLPMEAAVHSGAHDIIAVLATSLTPPTLPTNFNDAGMARMQLHVLSANLRDGQMRSLRFQRPEGSVLKVIEPTVEVIGPLEVTPELVRIDMDYGWMRAAEVMLGDPDRVAMARGASDGVTIARERCFYLERRWQEIAVHRRDHGEREAIKQAHSRARAHIIEHAQQWADEGLPQPEGFDCWADRAVESGK